MDDVTDLALQHCIACFHHCHRNTHFPSNGVKEAEVKAMPLSRVFFLSFKKGHATASLCPFESCSLAVQSFLSSQG